MGSEVGLEPTGHFTSDRSLEAGPRAGAGPVRTGVGRVSAGPGPSMAAADTSRAWHRTWERGTCPAGTGHRERPASMGPLQPLPAQQGHGRCLAPDVSAEDIKITRTRAHLHRCVRRWYD